MGWEQRGNAHYFYRKERVNGRGVSTYHGHGAHGVLMAALHQHVADARQATRTQHQCAHAQIACDEARYTALAAQCHELAMVILLAGGYHQHKGQWRKRRMAKTASLASFPPRPDPGDTSRDALRVLMQRCNRQDAAKEDIAALRELVTTTYPHVGSLGDMLALALDGITKGEGFHATLGLTIATTEATITLRKRALGYAHASPLEQPLIVHLVLCEQRLGIVEMLYAQHSMGH